MLPHYTILAEGAAVSIKAAEPIIGAVELPGVFAVMWVTWMFRELLKFAGKRLLPRTTWWDDALRLGFALVGYSGALTTVPRIHGWVVRSNDSINAFVVSAGWGAVLWILILVVVAAAALGGKYYYRNNDARGLTLFILGTLCLVSLPWMQIVIVWYVTHIGIPISHGLIAAWNYWIG